MAVNVRALIVVLILAIPAFYLGRKLTARFIVPREFAVWRNAWFAITIAAFLSGNYLVFATIAAAIFLYAHAKREAATSLFYLYLFAVPIVNVELGGFGLANSFFALNNGRELAIMLLLPALFAAGNRSNGNSKVYTTPDWLVLGYALFLSGLQFRQSELTNVVRSAFVHSLDILIPYFAFSRTVTSLSDFRKVLLAYIVAVLPLSLIATFEFGKGWHLYAGVADQWGQAIGYVQRDGLLRAAGSAGGGIMLGYVCMVAIGCVLAIWHRVPQRVVAAISAVISFGLVVALSRGPWIGTAVLITCFFAMGERAILNLGKLVLVSVVMLSFLLLTPGGEGVLKLLPFLGTVDEGSVTYRQELFNNSLIVIERNLWIGTPDFLSTPEMQALIQGEGIVDTVNSYLGVALESGIVGLSLFVGCFAMIIAGLRQVLKSKLVRDQDVKTYARAAMATLFAILVVIGTTSSIDFVPYVYWSFAGLCVALIRIAFRQRAEPLRSGNYRAGLPTTARIAHSSSARALRAK